MREFGVNRALQFRRRLTMAGICILSLLLIAFYLALRSAAQSTKLNQMVEHTQEVLGTIAEARLDRARLENDAWSYRETVDPTLQQKFQDDREGLNGTLKRLRQLTADSPSQQELLVELTAAMSTYVNSLEAAMQKASQARTSELDSSTVALIHGPVLTQVHYFHNTLEANERALLVLRSANENASERRTSVVLVFAGVVSFAILIVSGHMIQREMMMREQMEDGLRRTEGLLREKAAALALSEEELRNQYAILRSVLESMSDGVVVADKEGHFTLFNPAAEQILGAGRADIPPAEWSQHYQVYQPDQITPYPTEELPLVRAVRGETTNEVRLCVRNRRLSRLSCINISGRPLIASDGSISGGVVVFHDITAILEANHELEAFVYSVSHDLRAPLRHLDGFSRMLQQECSAVVPSEAMHYADRIRTAAKLMTELVEALLHLSRVGRQFPRRERFSLRTIAEEIRAIAMEEATGRKIRWKIQELPEVEGDRVLVQQVLANLCSNAVKFTRHLPEAEIEIGSREEGGEMFFFVRDNGAGFDPRFADKLFGVFQRLHRQDEYEGTGIGLAIVQRIISKHGGRVWAESAPGRGATFYFTLPTEEKEVRSTGECIGARV